MRNMTFAALIVAAVILPYTSTTMARVIHSPKVPLSGSYVVSGSKFCSNTTSLIVARTDSGQATFTPDNINGGPTSLEAFNA